MWYIQDALAPKQILEPPLLFKRNYGKFPWDKQSVGKVWMKIYEQFYY